MNTSRRVVDLHLYYQPIVRELMKRAPSRGLYPFITQGRRSREYQACLYAQGRVTPGESLRVDSFVVHTFLAAGGKSVIARCGIAENVVERERWKINVTSVLWSFHILGFAIDLSFRSAPDKLDDLVHDLEEQKAWVAIAKLYTAMATLAKEIAPDIIWGGTWKKQDLPHLEWHPGRTLGQLRAGLLPAYPKQCPRCSNFRPVMVNDICGDCHEAALRKCVGLS